jgi:N-acetylmuramate 1-kinase
MALKARPAPALGFHFPSKAPSLDSRLEALKAWVGTVLDVAEYELRPASEDASFRRYFRVTSPGATHIVMDAPPAREDSRPFIEVARP